MYQSGTSFSLSLTAFLSGRLFGCFSCAEKSREQFRGQGIVEVVRNHDGVLIHAQGTSGFLRLNSNQSRNGFARTRDDNLFALRHALQQSRKMRFGLMNVYFHAAYSRLSPWTKSMVRLRPIPRVPRLAKSPS